MTDNDDKERLADGLPSFNSALLVLRDMGYVISLTELESSGEDVADEWSATKGNVELFASDPLGLLGLATIWEKRGRWDNKNDYDLYGQIVSATYGED